jgi:membrane protein implicated in regulation of membrane protease activity
MDAFLTFYAEHGLWFWMGLAAALLAVEILTGSGWLLWAAAASAAVGMLGLAIDLTPTTALLVFAALTIVSTLLARRYVPRSTEAGDDLNDNVGRLLGQRGAMVSSGRVAIDGKEWPAVPDGESALKSGTPVEVVRIEGSRLTVRVV